MRKLTALAACAALGFGFTGTASADIVLSTTLMDFGNVVIGQQRAQGFDIENTGTEPLTNFAVFFYGQELWFGSTDCPMTFFAGQRCTSFITFAPTRPGIFRKKLIISGDDSTGSFEEVVRLEGRAVK